MVGRQQQIAVGRLARGDRRGRAGVEIDEVPVVDAEVMDDVVALVGPEMENIRAGAPIKPIIAAAPIDLTPAVVVGNPIRGIGCWIVAPRAYPIFSCFGCRRCCDFQSPFSSSSRS